jgi:hypothetical protein
MTASTWRDRYPPATVQFVDDRDAAEAWLRRFLPGEWGGDYLGKFTRVSDRSRDLWRRFTPEFNHEWDGPLGHCGHGIDPDRPGKALTIAEIRRGTVPWMGVCPDCLPDLDHKCRVVEPRCDVCQASTPTDDTTRWRVFAGYHRALLLRLCCTCVGHVGPVEPWRGYFWHDYDDYKAMFAPFLVQRRDGSRGRRRKTLTLAPVPFEALLGELS